MTRQRPLVLVVEDEQAISDLLAFHLEQSGFYPVVASEGREALALAQDDRVPALVILDLMLPDFDGIDLLKILRRERRLTHVPVILLTARAEEADRILGLEVGADDYVTKPFSPRELMLRVQRLVASREFRSAQAGVHVSGVLRIDEGRFHVTVNDQPVDISATEMRLLTTLMRGEGTVFTRARLLEEAWGYMPNVTERTVDTHIKRLRQKLGEAADYVETVRGVGYRWAGPTE